MSDDTAVRRATLRFPNETDAEFVRRAERACRVAKLLAQGALANHCVREFIADPELPYTEESVRTSPDVRVDYEEAVAIGGIGETLRVTKSKHWGDGPYILPLEPDDPVDSMRIIYVFKPNSRYNRHFEQRMRLKELLRKRYRPLVAKAKMHSKGIFLDLITVDQANAIRRILKCEPGHFWRACQGKIFLDLPPRWVQLELDFDAASAPAEIEPSFPSLKATVRITKKGPHRGSIGQVVHVERGTQPGLFDDGLDYWIEISDGFRVRCRSNEFEAISTPLPP